MDALNILLLAGAAFVAWRLWSVLGTRNGFEKPPLVFQPKTEKQNTQNQPPAEEAEVLPPEGKPPVWQGHAPEGSPLALGLEQLAARMPDFTVSSFSRGASAAYEMVLEAYAAGDKKALKTLLATEIWTSFSSAIDDRVAKGQTMKFQFVGVKSSELKRAALNGNKAHIEMTFVSDMISATLDKNESVVDGDDKAIRTITDSWTFERDVTSRDPNWKLIATDDND
jgi:predicted lipid-binding transport protein (Tim44 family)